MTASPLAGRVAGMAFSKGERTSALPIAPPAPDLKVEVSRYDRVVQISVNLPRTIVVSVDYVAGKWWCM